MRYLGFESIIHECQSPGTSAGHRVAQMLTICSRPLVQLPRNQVPRCQWLLQVLGLVR